MMNSGDVCADAAPSPPTLKITPRALLEVRQPGSPAVHPDGHRVAFELDEPDFEGSQYLSHLWITEWMDPIAAVPETSENGEADEATAIPGPDQLTRQLTWSRCSEWNPQWSPDGTLLAFLSDRPDPTASEDAEDAEEPTVQLWVLPIDGGEARKLTSAKEGVLAYRWFPDGSSLLVLAPEPFPAARAAADREKDENLKIDPVEEPEHRKRRRLWRVSSDSGGGRPQLIWPGDPGIVEVAISPDGEVICFASNGTGDANDYSKTYLYLLRSYEEGARWENRVLCTRGGDKSSLRWSPDGSQIAFLSSLDPELSFAPQTLYTVLVPNAEDVGPVDAQRALPGRDCDVLEIEWDGGGGIIGIAANGTTDSLFRYTATEPDIAPVFTAFLDDQAACYRGLAVEPAGYGFCWIAEGRQSLPELRFSTTEGPKTLTAINTDFTERYVLPTQSTVCWKAADGTTIEGVLTLPPAGTASDSPLPLLLHLHGGPHGRAVDTLQGYLMPALWAASGYAVLAPNYRGSEGYGEAFALASRCDLGGGDFDDCMAGVDWCIEQRIADADRLGVMGGSYGGFLTNCAIGRTNRFKAAISMFGIFSLKADAGTSSFYRWNLEYLGGTFWEQPELYTRLSPDRFAAAIQTPTLILHGDEDENTYPGNSRELYQTLKLRNVPVSFVHYPREGHGINEPNHRLDEIRRSLAWMRRYLPASQPWQPGDWVPSEDGIWELCVHSADPMQMPATRPQQPAGAPRALLLEVCFSISARQHSGKSAVALEAMPLSTLALTVPSSSVPLSPTGVTAEALGVKALIRGADLELSAVGAGGPGNASIAASIVFSLPSELRTGGDALFLAPGFQPVSVCWASEPDEEPEAEM